MKTLPPKTMRSGKKTAADVTKSFGASTRRSTSGVLAPRSISTRTMAATIEARNSRMTAGERQPHSWPWLSASSSIKRPANARAALTALGIGATAAPPGACWPDVCRPAARRSTIATSATDRLKMKMDSQPNMAVS